MKKFDAKKSRLNKKLKIPINRNFKYEQNGNSKIEIPNLKVNVDIRKLAESAKKRQIKGDGLAEFDVDEFRARKKEKVLNRKKSISESKIKSTKGEFVLLDGSEYEGYYHIQDDGTVMSEATYLIDKSQPLITRTDWVDNKETYLIISNKMEYKNPYRKVKLNKERSNRKMMKSRIMGRPGKSSGGGSSSGGSSGGGGY
jgi:hypothetical protein